MILKFVVYSALCVKFAFLVFRSLSAYAVLIAQFIKIMRLCVLRAIDNILKLVELVRLR